MNDRWQYLAVHKFHCNQDKIYINTLCKPCLTHQSIKLTMLLNFCLFTIAVLMLHACSNYRKNREKGSINILFLCFYGLSHYNFPLLINRIIFVHVLLWIRLCFYYTYMYISHVYSDETKEAPGQLFLTCFIITGTFIAVLVCCIFSFALPFNTENRTVFSLTNHCKHITYCIIINTLWFWS